MTAKRNIPTQPEGTPEQLEALRREHEEADREYERLLAEGRPGDEPPELTPEDEAILDEIWTPKKGAAK